jgi:GT2 family glycosyltransferase
MSLSIVIVNYNTKELLKQCLECLKWEMGNGKWEVIVVDNGSTDGSPEMAREFAKKHSCLFVIENRSNLGFAKAVNQGIRQAVGEYILLLNSDTVVRPGALRAMVDFAKAHPLVGVVGGRLLNQDGSIQGSCYHLPGVWRAIKEFWLGTKEISVFKKYTPEGKSPVEVEAVMGAVFLIPRKVINKVGLLDERYFMYFEDLDYCRRVRKAGFKIYYLPKAEFIHHHGASGRQIPQQTHQWLVESSKIYHGKFKYYLITLIIWIGQKWQKISKQ